MNNLKETRSQPEIKTVDTEHILRFIATIKLNDVRRS